MYSDQTKQEVLDWLQKGYSVRWVAKKMGVSKTFVGGLKEAYCVETNKENIGRPQLLSDKYRKALKRDFLTSDLRTCTDGAQRVF